MRGRERKREREKEIMKETGRMWEADREKKKDRIVENRGESLPTHLRALSVLLLCQDR